MRSIQEVGKEILLDSPAKLYIMVGSEYGVKCRYIDHLKEYYKGNYVEASSVTGVLESMRKKHLVPLKPTLYIIRYDESFISSLSDKTSKQVDGTNVVGTIVCLYEGSKYNSKLDKYVGNYTVSVDTVGDKFVEKYLHADFPGIADRLVKVAMQCSSNYGQARTICRAMQAGDERTLMSMSDESLHKLFNFQSLGTEAQIRLGVAARNFPYLVEVLDGITDYDGVIYMVIQTMIDMDKALDSGYPPAEFKEYMKGWNRSDVYITMLNAYNTLKVGRSISSKLKENTISLFFSLCQSPIPALRW